MKITIVGPVYPYRAGIAYCTTRLAEELARTHEVAVVSFKRQYPRWLYPGGNDRDPSLESRTPSFARFALDILNPITWIVEGRRLRREKADALIVVWWIWVWAIPYLTLMKLSGSPRVVLQCHNIGDKEPARWKTWLTNLVLRRGDLIIVHAKTEAEEAIERLGRTAKGRVHPLFLPVHELGTAPLTRVEAKSRLGLGERNVALFFGHVRPFKGLDLALGAWNRIKSDVVLVVAGEVWWNDEERYRRLANTLGDRVRFDFRFIPDSEVSLYFSASDVVLAPYRREAQSGVALTAFHFGRPVIATNVGGLPEIIEDGVNGLLVPPEDEESLAQAVDRFFSEMDREAMDGAAAATARKYSWADYGSKVGGLL